MYGPAQVPILRYGMQLGLDYVIINRGKNPSLFLPDKVGLKKTKTKNIIFLLSLCSNLSDATQNSCVNRNNYLKL